ncbi:MAG: hypothetical protein ACK4HE_01445 [Chitinophagaceae bacterium]
MDLDGLKNEWQAIAGTQQQVSADFIQKSIKQQPLTVLGKIKRSLLFEVSISWLMLALFAVWGVVTDIPFIRWYMAAVLPILVVFYAVITRLYRYIKQQEKQYDADLKTHLTSLHKLLLLFQKRYLQFNIAFALLCLLLATFLPLMFADNNARTVLQNIMHAPITKQLTLIAGVLLMYAIFITLTYLFVRLWIKYLYGNYILQLEKSINDLEAL